MNAVDTTLAAEEGALVEQTIAPTGLANEIISIMSEPSIRPIEVPVVMDFAEASAADTEIAKRLRAEADGYLAKLNDRPSKSGPLRALSASRSDLFNLNPFVIKVKDGWNSRDPNDPENAAHIDWLARSIAEVGVKEALTVIFEDENVYVVSGHCRLLGVMRAIKVYNAEIKSIPVRLEDRFGSDADRVADQFVRNSGKQLSVLEQATGYVKLSRLGWSVEEIAKRVGVEKARVYQVLSTMARTTEETRKLIATGQIRFTTAQQALAASDSVAEGNAILHEAVVEAKKDGKTKATAKHVAKVREARDEASGVPKTLRGVMRMIWGAKSTVIEEDGRLSISKRHRRLVESFIGIET